MELGAKLRLGRAQTPLRLACLGGSRSEPRIARVSILARLGQRRREFGGARASGFRFCRRFVARETRGFQFGDRFVARVARGEGFRACRAHGGFGGGSHLRAVVVGALYDVQGQRNNLFLLDDGDA